MELIVRPDAEALAQAAADRILRAAGEAISDRGKFSVALTGGSTPETLYLMLAAPSYSVRLDWLHTEVFFGDERCVPPDHEWSNYGMALRALLSQVPLPPSQLHRMRGELAPDVAAEDYAQLLASNLPAEELAWPCFDLILLGMGDDGHTASLFPGTQALDERRATVVATGVPSYARPQVPRVTLTLPVLNSAREVMFLVTGRGKSRMVEQVLNDVRTGEAWEGRAPAASVQPPNGRLAWFLDRMAASQIQWE